MKSLYKIIRDGNADISLNSVKVINNNDHEIINNAEESVDTTKQVINNDNISSKEIEATQKAQEILKQAKEEAEHIIANASSLAKSDVDKIIEKANQDAEIIKEEVRKEAYSKAYEDCISDVEEHKQKFLCSLDTFIEETIARQIDFNNTLEENIFEISSCVCKKIISTSIEKDKNLILNIIKDAISHFKDKDRITITLSKKLSEDIDKFNMSLSKTKLFKDKKIDFELKDISDTSIYISDDDTVLDASIESQLNALKEIFEN